MATEIELKLTFPEGGKDSQLETVKNVLQGLGVEPEFSVQRLENAYYDTADFKLNQRRVALRIRKKSKADGQVLYIQTLKTAGQSHAGLSQRGEWEWQLSELALDLAELSECDAWPAELLEQNPVKIFETNFTRYACLLNWGGSRIELVLDWGEIVSNNKTQPLHEIELELKAGDTHDLLELSEKLMQALPVRPLDISKAERGFNLFKTH